MNVEIREEPIVELERWADVPIRFRVESRFVVTTDGKLGEERVTPSYEYDYDAHEPPTHWKTWDLRHWGFFTALDESAPVGRAAIAMRTPDLLLLEGRDDVAALWDIRVRHESRGSGIGRALFQSACAWAARRGATSLTIETQNINVPACRFYERLGCRLTAVNPGIYAHARDQIQLLYSRALAKGS